MFMLNLVKEVGSDAIINVVQGFADAASDKGIKDYAEALSKRNGILRLWNNFMDEYPIILAPVSASPPFEQHEDQKGPERFAKILQEQSPQYVINLLGLPSVAVPTGLNNNIPTGVQIITPRFCEDFALDVAKIIEDEVGILCPKLW